MRPFGSKEKLIACSCCSTGCDFFEAPLLKRMPFMDRRYRTFLSLKNSDSKKINLLNVTGEKKVERINLQDKLSVRHRKNLIGWGGQFQITVKDALDYILKCGLEGLAQYPGIRVIR